MNDPLLLEQRSANVCAGKQSIFTELCRRAGLLPVTVSDRLADTFLRALPEYGPSDNLILYDLVWSVRGAVKGLIPCVRNSGPDGERFLVEFWSLGAGGEPELQQVQAVVRTEPDGGQRMHLDVPDTKPTPTSSARHIVLIIEDNPDVAQMEQMLLEQAGFIVVVVHEGKTGVRFAQTQLPDALVLDLDLPDLSGLEVCRAMKADPHTRRIPILICSGNTESESAALVAGAAGFLPKPEGIAELATELRRILDV